jgi:hypothetical protein
MSQHAAGSLGDAQPAVWLIYPDVAPVMHRIREAMGEPYFGSQMGGFQRPVQADETFVGRRTSRAGKVHKRGYAEKEPGSQLPAPRRLANFQEPTRDAIP